MAADITADQIAQLFQTLSEVTEPQAIGKGGQKSVFKAQHKQHGTIAFKIIKPVVETKQRIVREIRAVKILADAHIPAIHDTNIETVVNDGDLVWLVEEFIDGSSLREVIRGGRKFQVNEVLDFLETMLQILVKCEANRIVHRDIKPENIILSSDNKFWLIDFGISRHLDLASLTSTSNPFGAFTIGYAASEQLRNLKKDIDTRADLFAVGVVAAEMMLGYNPYLHKMTDVLQVIKNIERQPLPLLRLEGDRQFLLAKFIKTLGDNRLSRRPKTAVEAYEIFNVIKNTFK